MILRILWMREEKITLREPTIHAGSGMPFFAFH